MRIVFDANTIHESKVERCMEDRRGARVVHEAVIQVTELQEELTSFAQAVSNACAMAHIESPDVDNVRKLLPN
jgi:hypothetical protein